MSLGIKAEVDVGRGGARRPGGLQPESVPQFTGGPAPGPILRFMAQAFGHGIGADVFNGFKELFAIAHAMIEIIRLPANAECARGISFPFTNHTAHPFIPGKCQQGVCVIRHQQKEVAVPPCPAVTVVGRVEERRCDGFVGQDDTVGAGGPEADVKRRA